MKVSASIVWKKNLIVIRPLSKYNLKGALEVLDKVFGESEEDKFGYTRGFNASLGNKKYLAMYPAERPKYLKYFVALDKKTGKVVGTTGLYAYEKDWRDNAFSTGWFGVDPVYRGLGIGKQLLTFTIEKAKKLKRKYLRLWTSDTELTETARKMYESRGFIITAEKKEAGKDYTTIYMELKI
ncbi:MAG: GNAT family N-acetyltransferase [Nanoarchaeota archaeon]